MGVIETLRQPEHTGQRRCWPCTAVNLVLVIAGSVAVSLLTTFLAGAVFVLLGVAVIAIRGYLVPYTPKFAPTLVDSVPGPRTSFDHDPEPVTGSGSVTIGNGLGDLDEEDLLAILIETGVIVPEGETLALDSAFRERWEADARDLRTASIEDLAHAIQSFLPAFEVSVENQAREHVIVLTPPGGGVVDETWRTRPVAIAEIAAARALSSEELDPRMRLAAAEPLRMFLAVCPVCDGAVEETTTVACCGGAAGARSDPDAVLACSECDRKLFTFPG